MIDVIKTVRRILKHKNSLIRRERQKLLAAEHENRILSAYIAYLAKQNGALSIPRSEISALLGRYRSQVSADRENYIITLTEDREGMLEGKDARGAR